MPRTYWKVLKANRKSARGAKGKGSVSYPVNTWVKPKIEDSRLFIFSSKAAAEHFQMCEELLVPCHAKGIIRGTSPSIFMVYFFDTPLEGFWKEWNTHRKMKTEYTFSCTVEKPPTGTCWAKSIKCLK